ncbi:hypothetical protein ACFWA1_36015 [Streptomyces sp. NPDC060005]|uniref:DUF6197 family protein n=1 Tax=Streptomyces sp. NPDC060005 TaxID=3347034 RepID=UPI00368BD22B
MHAPSTAAPAPTRAAHDSPPLSLELRLEALSALMDHRLTEAAAAIDVNTAVHVPDVEPVDLADVIRGPVDQPRTPVTLYPTPVAALLQRALDRLQRDGWCTGAMVGEAGARCLYGAIRVEASSRSTEGAALDVLLDAIRRQFPGADSVPGFNDAHGPRVVFRVLGQAADLAHARGL